MWVIRNWRLVVVAAVAALLGALGIRITLLQNSLDKEVRRSKELESYKEGREAYDEVDDVLSGDVDASREFLQRRQESKAPGFVRRDRRRPRQRS